MAVVTQLWQAYGVILVATGLAVPVTALVVWWRCRRGRRRWRDTAAEAAIVIGTLPWLAMTMTPDPAATSRINLVPLHDLADLATATAGTIVVQLIGNLLVFAALGFFLPIRFAAFASLTRILAVATAGSVLIETIQYVGQLGRVSSVDDVLVNALGAVLAALLSSPWWRPAKPATRVRPSAAE